MTGAIEFLRKAKMICKHRYDNGQSCIDHETGNSCPSYALCNPGLMVMDDADLVRKVMNYQIEDSKRN